MTGNKRRWSSELRAAGIARGPFPCLVTHCSSDNGVSIRLYVQESAPEDATAVSLHHGV